LPIFAIKDTVWEEMRWKMELDKKDQGQKDDKLGPNNINKVLTEIKAEKSNEMIKARWTVTSLDDDDLDGDVFGVDALVILSPRKRTSS